MLRHCNYSGVRHILLEHIPSPMITDEAATSVQGSSKQDIVLNRLADHFAKQQIQDTARAIKNDLVCKEVDVFGSGSLWLAQCNRLMQESLLRLREYRGVQVPLSWKFSIRPDRCFQDGHGMCPSDAVFVASTNSVWICRFVRATNSPMQISEFF